MLLLKTFRGVYTVQRRGMNAAVKNIQRLEQISDDWNPPPPSEILCSPLCPRDRKILHTLLIVLFACKYCAGLISHLI